MCGYFCSGGLWALIIVPKSPSKTVANVTVRCEYGYNNGDALFDELSLTRQAAQTYTYDANGNLKKVGTTSNRDVDYSYNGNNDLTSFTDRTGVTYSYWDKRPACCKRNDKPSGKCSHWDNGSRCSIAYNAWGNLKLESLRATEFCFKQWCGAAHYLRAYRWQGGQIRRLPACEILRGTYDKAICTL